MIVCSWLYFINSVMADTYNPVILTFIIFAHEITSLLLRIKTLTECFVMIMKSIVQNTAVLSKRWSDL